MQSPSLEPVHSPSLLAIWFEYPLSFYEMSPIPKIAMPVSLSHTGLGGPDTVHSVPGPGLCLGGKQANQTQPCPQGARSGGWEWGEDTRGPKYPRQVEGRPEAGHGGAGAAALSRLQGRSSFLGTEVVVWPSRWRNLVRFSRNPHLPLNRHFLQTDSPTCLSAPHADLLGLLRPPACALRLSHVTLIFHLLDVTYLSVTCHR